jgi:RHS repeat-associated protein
MMTPHGDEHHLRRTGRRCLENLTYEYDKNENRIKTGGSFARTGIPEGISTTAYNAANHQTTFGDETLTYDDNGNLTSITDSTGTTTYTWNARNQLTGISGPGVSATFVYDGLGRREKKTINSDVTEFLYDGLNPVQETSGSTVLANILPGLGIDEFLTRTDAVAGVTGAFLTDALGSPVAVTDTSGAVQTEYTYEPFGKTTVSGASNTNPYQYTGRENDGTELYYYRARYYRPDLQRFISEDPIRFRSGDTNLYAYVTNAPLRYKDPSGTRGWDIVLRQILKRLGGAVGKRIAQIIDGNPLVSEEEEQTRLREHIDDYDATEHGVPWWLIPPASEIGNNQEPPPPGPSNPKSSDQPINEPWY